MADTVNMREKHKRRRLFTAEEILAEIGKESPLSSDQNDEDSNDASELKDNCPEDLDLSAANCLELSAESQDAVDLLKIAIDLASSPFHREGELQKGEGTQSSNERNVATMPLTNNLDALMDVIPTDVPMPSPIQRQGELLKGEGTQSSNERNVATMPLPKNLDALMDVIPTDVLMPSPIQRQDLTDSDDCTTNVPDEDYQPSETTSSDTESITAQDREEDDTTTATAISITTTVAAATTTTTTTATTAISSTGSLTNAHQRKKRGNGRDPENWGKNVPKNKRLKGEAHVSRRGKERGHVELKPTCTSTFCLNSIKRFCSTFTLEDRKDMFVKFWDLPSWHARQSIVATLTSVKDKKQIKATNTKRGNPHEYFLKKKDGSKHQVCREMFCSTLGIPTRTISDWLNTKNKVDTENGDQHSENNQTNETSSRKLTDEEIKNLKLWLLKLDTVDSHYCRSSESYKNKRFLEPGVRKTDLYERYCIDSKAEGVRAACLTIFKKYFKDLGFSIFRPRKDQCDLCVGYHHSNVSKDEYDKHIARKDKARAEKDNDKKMAQSLEDDSMSVWTFDTQSVMLCPQTKASALYFRTKLQVHNFTLYNNCTREGFCYFWDETEGELKAENFTSIQYSHFKTILSSNSNIKTLVLWSDGCLYQNKNNYLSNCYLQLAMEHNVDIFQKYLVVGHTQMECDSMHSVIERNLVCDIYTPSDLRVVMETARRHPSPYKVKQLHHADFQKMSDIRFNSIRPGRKAGESVVTQLSHICYTPKGQILYKVFHEAEDWRILPTRIATIAPENIEWVPLYTGKLPITKRKFEDLQAMKKVLPPKDHSYYDNLEFM